MRTAASVLRSEDEEEEERLPAPARLLIALLIVFALLWQVRVPIVRFACGHGWLSTQTCGALLPTEPVPVAPPAPAAPATP